MTSQLKFHYLLLVLSALLMYFFHLNKFRLIRARAVSSEGLVTIILWAFFALFSAFPYAKTHHVRQTWYPRCFSGVASKLLCSAP